jgi:60 kDa SS-A/Ro ribonucleoprotein
LNDEKELEKARIHPINVLAAHKTYGSGHGFRGSNSWNPIPSISAALESAFYKSFKFIEPTGKKILLALDVSGSMSCGSCAGIDVLTPMEGVAAMAMAIAKVEKNYHIMAFGHNLVPVNFNHNSSLESVIKALSSIPMGGTDCSIPMIYAKQNKLTVDAFVVLTDNETWAGHIQPFEALKQYRKHSGIHNSRLIVGATSATGFSIADPNDPGMLDVCGFGSDTPQLITNFIAGRI